MWRALLSAVLAAILATASAAPAAAQSPTAASRAAVSAIPPLAKPAGGRTAPSLRLGEENNAFMFGNTNAATAALGAPTLGASNYRAVSLPTAHALIPATGDQFLVLHFRTAKAGAANSGSARLEYLLAYDGAANTATPGGGFKFGSTSAVKGSGTGGQDIDSTIAGIVKLRRQAAPGWQLWNQSVLDTVTAAALGADTRYCLILGDRDLGSTDQGAMFIIQAADGTALTGGRIDAPLTSTKANRPTSQSLFTIIGALNGATDRSGFGGSVSDYAVAKGAAGSFPTLAQAQDICTGKVDLAKLPAYLDPTGSNSVALQYYNRLDATTISGTSLPADPAGATSGAATVVGTGVTPSAPIRVASRITLTRLGRWWVFPMQAGPVGGAYVADAWFEGTAPAGAVIECRMNYANGGASRWARGVADRSGAYVLKLTQMVTASRPFTRYCRPANDPLNAFDEQDLMDLGAVIAGASQSEGRYQYAFQATALAANSATDTGGTGHALGQPGSITGPWASMVDIMDRSNNGLGFRGTKGIPAGVNLIYGSGMGGDGVARRATDYIALSGFSVMYVPMGHPGTSIDALIFDGVTFTKSITVAGSGAGPYAYTFGLTSADLNTKFGTSGLVLTSPWRDQVKPGSLSLSINGETITDIKIDDQHGTLSGTGGATGTITYVDTTAGGATPASLSITFTGTPGSTTGTLTYTAKSETDDVDSKGKVANINGYTFKSATDASLSLTGRFGFTHGDYWWWTNMLTETGSAAAQASDIGSKFDLLDTYVRSYQDAKHPLQPGLARFPWVIAEKGRDTSNGTNGTANSVDRNRQAAGLIVAARSSFAWLSAHFYDTRMDLNVSPHQDFASPNGGQRVGAYQARNDWSVDKQDRTINQGPSWGTPTMNGGSTIITVPGTLHGGTALTVNTGGNANALDEWYVGTPSTGTRIANDAVTIARIAANGHDVELVKLSGTWSAGDETRVHYAVSAPGPLVQAEPASLVYDNRGGLGTVPGLLADPIP